MPKLSPLPREFARGVFTVAAARGAGIPVGRLRRRDLAAPFHGVRAPRGGDDSATPDTIDAQDASEYWARMRELAVARALSFHERLRPGVVFSHTTAAQLHGFYLPPRLAADLRVHVATETESLRPRTRGVRHHLVPTGRVKVTKVDSLTATAPLDTWCMLAPLLTVDELITIGDQLVQRQSPLATVDDLHSAVRRHAGRHGVRKLRVAVPSVRPRTDSPKETELRLLLVRAGLPEPSINAPVVDHAGNRIRLGDLVYERERILIEYDGALHRDNEVQFHKDVDDLERAMESGWRVIKVDKFMLRDRAQDIVSRTRAALRERLDRSV